MGDGWKSDGVVLDLRGVRPKIERADASGRAYFCVAAGHTIHDVLQALEPQGFALEASTNFTGVSYIGAAQTCSHGSGPLLPPMGAQIRAYEVADAEGLLRGVQSPDDRVLERIGYRGRVVTSQSELDALSVSLGVLGVITRVWLEPVRDYALRESRWHTSWRIARRLMLAGEPYSHHAQSYLIVPYPRADRERSCSVSTNEKLPAAGASHRESLRTLLPQAAHLLKNLAIFKRRPRRIPALLEQGLEVFNAEREVEGPAAAMLGQHYYGFPPSGCGLELSVPYTKTATTGAVELIDALLDEIEALRADDRFVGGFISVRFSRRWDAHLSLSHGSDACHVELLMLEGTPGGRETLLALERSLRRFNPRLHFGLLHGSTREDVEAAYPALGEFRRVAARLDPTGVFANGLSDRLGLTGARANVAGKRLWRVG
jgi:xylitol oxidase